MDMVLLWQRLPLSILVGVRCTKRFIRYSEKIHVVCDYNWRKNSDVNCKML